MPDKPQQVEPENTWGPVRAYQEEAQEQMGEGGERGRGGVPTVLVVEDNADVRAYLRTRLAPRYHVTGAENGIQALEQIYERRPDLVLSDVMMPEMDGFELCRQIKRDERLQDLPIILLTARAETADEVEGLEVGADAYVEKPFDAAALKARIENLIASRQQLREQYSREVVVQPHDVTVTSEEEAFLRQARDVAEQHLRDRHFTVEAFAAKFDLSKSQLTRKLKKVSGLPPGAFLRELRLKRAAQLIEEEAGSVAQVAQRIGYADAEYFSRRFRERFGVPPSRYPDET